MDFHNFIHTYSKFLRHNLEDDKNNHLSTNQLYIFNQIENNDKTFILKGRQDGISTLLSYYSIWKILSNSKIKIGYVNKYSVVDRCFKLFLENQTSGNKLIKNSSHRKEFQNGSEIHYLIDFYLSKGSSYDYIIIDEVDNRNLENALMVMNFHRGKIIICSTFNHYYGFEKINSIKKLGYNVINGSYNGMDKFIYKKQLLIEKCNLNYHPIDKFPLERFGKVTYIDYNMIQEYNPIFYL